MLRSPVSGHLCIGELINLLSKQTYEQKSLIWLRIAVAVVCEYPHQGWFQTTSMMSLKAEFERKCPELASGSIPRQLPHTPESQQIWWPLKNTASHFDILAKNASPSESSHREHQTFSLEVMLLKKNHFIKCLHLFWRTGFEVWLHWDLRQWKHLIYYCTAALHVLFCFF